MIRSAITAAAITAAAAALSAAVPAGDVRIAWDNATMRDITELPIVNKGYVETNIMYPRIKRLADGRLMMSFMNNTYGWEPYVAFSTDNGATWLDAMRLVEQVKGTSSAGDDELVIVNPDFIQLADGTIMLAYQRRWKKGYNDLEHTNENCFIEIMTSADNGKTWSEPRRIYTGRCWEPAMLQLPSGEIQMYITDSNEVKYKRSQPCTVLIRSLDGGKTWQGKKECTYRDGEIISRTFDERGSYDGMASAVRLDDGSLVLPVEVWSGALKVDQTPVIIRTDSATNWRSDQSIRRNGGPEYPAKKQIHKDLWAYGPYITRLPSGEPVVLAGGRFKGKNGAWVLIGDRNGDNFTAATSPFEGYWGAIDYIGDNRVMVGVTHDYKDNGEKRSMTKTAIGRLNYSKHPAAPEAFMSLAQFDRDNNSFWFLGKEQPSQVFVDFSATPEALVIDGYLFDTDLMAYTPENSDAIGVLLGRRNDAGDYDAYKLTVNALGAYTLYREAGNAWVLIDKGTVAVETAGTINSTEEDTDMGFAVRFPLRWDLIGGTPKKGEAVKAHVRHYYKTTRKETPVGAFIEEAEGENTDYPQEWLSLYFPD